MGGRRKQLEQGEERELSVGIGAGRGRKKEIGCSERIKD